MATNFLIKNEGENAPIFVRVQKTHRNENGIRVFDANILKSTGLSCNSIYWKDFLSVRDGGKKSLNYRNYWVNGEGAETLYKLHEIENEIASHFDTQTTMDAGKLNEILTTIVGEKKKVVKMPSVSEYIAEFFANAENRIGIASDKILSKNTINAMKTACARFLDFEKASRRHYQFIELDEDFKAEFRHYLEVTKEFRANNVSKIFGELRTLCNYAERDYKGLKVSPCVKDGNFKTKRVDVDAIYLTAGEVEKFKAVPLSGTDEIARDIFLVGIYTAQRVSDYNHIGTDNIKTGENGKKYISLKQQKTGKKVLIPCKSELCEILEKYPEGLPFLWPQHINERIKKIGALAGIDSPVEVVSIKGGKKVVETFPKYKLIHTHTARRTGATWMYLAGMDIYDIMKATGHGSYDVLKKYIKADELDALKTLEKYDYFK